MLYDVIAYPSPCPEDEEFFVRPDAAGMEEAYGRGDAIFELHQWYVL